MSPHNRTPAYKQIVQTAFRLFIERGYDSTTYECIARESGSKKTNVQYYFPKKWQLFVLFIEKLLDEIVIIVDRLPRRGRRDDASTLYLIGQIYYAFLLADDNNCRLFFEAFFYREVTNELLTSNANWALRSFSLGGNVPEAGDVLMPAIIVASNGVYDLMYYALKNELPLDPLTLLAFDFKTFFALLPEGFLIPLVDYDGLKIDQATLEPLIEKLRDTLTGNA
ncbi:MAG: TetR/AcrR family transcriptional regulator [Coriobacteriales bacterium]|jgi:AcrR family transcriptional regulator|nr:TetR/AcrR family transcriptional regulator [Coriobacteriales bacterium]